MSVLQLQGQLLRLQSHVIASAAFVMVLPILGRFHHLPLVPHFVGVYTAPELDGNGVALFKSSGMLESKTLENIFFYL